MAEENPRCEFVKYKLADGKTVPVEVSPAVARFLENEERRERTRRREDRRFLDKDGYVEGETELLVYDLGQGVLDKVEKRERNNIVNDAINHLFPRQKSYIHAYYFKGYTVQEIADMESIDKAAVSRVLSKARDELKFYLEHYQQFGGYQQNG
ncbi:MAG: sigma-70 family RNA polymerase sigma factor [Ruminococcaceae bacterium]|nr:sigma-70 family RNA polymerase sigma factor [Oscillospiraceae bacterium]